MSKKISLLICLLISIYYIKSTFDLAPWAHKKIIDQDIVFYYEYVPAVFIYHDLGFNFPSQNPGFQGTVWCIPTPTGNGISKMTMGTAVLYSPVFGIAHLYTKLTGGLADGYSPNYHMALIWAGVLYFILGILLLRKSLLHFFDDTVVSIVLISLSFGTNLFNYASWEGAMSHIYSFFVFALALWAFLKWMKSPTYWVTLILGLALGMIVLIRPTNATFILFLALYFFLRPIPFKEKWQFIAGLKWKLLLLVISAILVCVPQIMYWKIYTDHYFYFSYLGERFYFNNPHIIDGLFSFNKGWFVYTPLMWLAVAGLFVMRGALKAWLWPTIIAMMLSFYIIFSWWCWWYGGGFSARALVEFYVVMSIPLGAFFAFIAKKNLVVKGITTVLVVFLLWLNLFQHEQYRKSLLHWDSMSKEAYWAIWGKQSWPENYDKMLLHLDAEKAKKGESAYP
ncbi:MAG: hypothetical protein WCI92_17140 [Bacteroidota bacterium]